MCINYLKTIFSSQLVILWMWRIIIKMNLLFWKHYRRHCFIRYVFKNVKDHCEISRRCGKKYIYISPEVWQSKTKSFTSKTFASHKFSPCSIRRYVYKSEVKYNSSTLTEHERPFSKSLTKQAVCVADHSPVISVCRMDWAREFLEHWVELSVPFWFTLWSLKSCPTQRFTEKHFHVLLSSLWTFMCKKKKK